MSKFLEEGDVFKLEAGMQVYTLLPARFIYTNRKFSEELKENEVKVDKLYEAPVSAEEDIRKIIKGVQDNFNWNGINLTWEEVEEMVMPKIPKLEPSSFILSEGLFVVIKTSMEGEGHGHGLHDSYPDGHKVTAKRLNEDGSYNPKGQEISFYQSGSFTAMIKNVEVIGRKEKSFI